MYAPYILYGQEIQTTAIIAILICAPLGAILMSTFGDKLLTKDVTVEPITDGHGTKGGHP